MASYRRYEPLIGFPVLLRHAAKKAHEKDE